MRRLPSALALALLALAAALAAPRARSAPPGGRDLVVLGGEVVHDGPPATAVLCRAGRIEAVGDDAAVRARAADEAVVVHADGGLVLPGLHDAHTHLLYAGLAALAVDLEGLTSLDAVLEAVRAWAAAHPDAPWVVGRGWSYDLVPAGQFPTRRDLDRAVADRPVLLESYDGHSAWANTRALALAEVGPDTPDPEGGRIVREADGRTPAGALLEDAGALVQAFVPPPTRATKRAALEGALEHCLRLGLTAATTIASDLEEVALFEELAAAGRLPLRVTLALPLDTDLDVAVRLRERLAGSPRLRVGWLKGFLDGVIESRTAFMLAPYSGGAPDQRGAPLIAPEALVARVTAAHARGLAVGLHTIGDGAARLALDAYAAAARANPRVTVRHRLEHLEALDRADVPRLRAQGVAASMQPYHAVPADDAGPAATDAWSTNLGPDRLARAFAWRELRDAGAVLAFGSDWPVFTCDPLRGVAVAATRANERGLPAGGWNPDQRLPVRDALRAYTHGSAWAVGREDELGRLTPGALADLVVLTPDVRLDDPASFWHGRAAHVVVDGALVRTGQ